MRTEYTQEFKESMLQKILLNPDRTVVSFAEEAIKTLSLLLVLFIFNSCS